MVRLDWGALPIHGLRLLATELTGDALRWVFSIRFFVLGV